MYIILETSVLPIHMDSEQVPH